jgi:hypothetical protein
VPSQNEIAYSEGMSFWRALIPSWRFFDQVGSTVELRYRSSHSPDSWSPWQPPSLPLNSRNCIRLMVNAEENLWLAKKAILERLAYELYDQREPDLQKLTDSLNYRLVQNWVEQELRSTKASLFQFELQVGTPGPTPSQERWLSAIHEL